MIDKAIIECADSIFAGDTLRMRQSLLQSHCENCRCVALSLVRQIGEYLGQVDRTVKAVYHYEPLEGSGKPANQGSPCWHQPGRVGGAQERRLECPDRGLGGGT